MVLPLRERDKDVPIILFLVGHPLFSSMELFGAAAAAVALVPIFINTGRAIREIAHNVKFAKREIGKLADEMEIFAEILVNLEDILRRRDNNSSIGTPGKIVIEFSRDIDHEAQRLLSSFQPLAPNSQYRHSFTEIAGAHVKWYTSKSEVNCIRAMLEVARESVNSLTNLHLIRQMDKVLQMLGAEMSSAQRQIIEDQFGMTTKELQDVLPLRM